MTCSQSLGGVAFALGMSALAGLLVPQVGGLGGLAFGGFSTLVGAPIVLVGGGLVGGIAWGCTKDLKVAGIAAGIGAVASLFLAFYCAQLICNRFDTLPPFTYADALTVFGHQIWMGLVLLLIGGCCLCGAVAAGLAKSSLCP